MKKMFLASIVLFFYRSFVISLLATYTDFFFVSDWTKTGPMKLFKKIILASMKTNLFFYKVFFVPFLNEIS